MTSVLRLTLLMVAAVAMLTAPAFAGGGGSKSKQTLEVMNDTGVEVYVIVLSSGRTVADLQADITKRAIAKQDPTFSTHFKAFGGELLGPGQVLETEVRKGNHTVAAAEANLVDAVDLTSPAAPATLNGLFESETFDIQTDTTLTVGFDAANDITL